MTRVLASDIRDSRPGSSPSTARSFSASLGWDEMRRRAGHFYSAGRSWQCPRGRGVCPYPAAGFPWSPCVRAEASDACWLPSSVRQLDTWRSINHSTFTDGVRLICAQVRDFPSWHACASFWFYDRSLCGSLILKRSFCLPSDAYVLIYLCVCLCASINTLLPIDRTVFC